VTTLDTAQKETFHRVPSFLPDGRRFLYRAQPSSAIFLASLDSTERRELLRADSKAVYANSGHLLFIRGSTLMAQPFDAERAEASGNAFRVADNVAVNLFNGRAAFSASDASVLAYWTGRGNVSQPAWFDRAGKLLGSVGEEGRYLQLALSPDGSKVAMLRTDDDGQNMWLLDLTRGISTRFTFESTSDPIWSPDGRFVAYSRQGNPNRLYRRSVDGGEEVLVWEGSELCCIDSWSPDGKLIAYHLAARTIGVVPPTGNGKPMVWLDTPFNKDEPHFSPDGRWIAYQSNEAGQTDVYVGAFPGPGPKIRVSTSGGGAPRWRADGRELFYLTPTGMLMAVAIVPGSRLDAGVPQPLFQTPIRDVLPALDQYDVAGDGQRFLILAPTSTALQTPITVVVNWTAGLEQ
jgi:WD40 repeat protein